MKCSKEINKSECFSGSLADSKCSLKSCEKLLAVKRDKKRIWEVQIRFRGNELKLVLSEIDPKTDPSYKNNLQSQVLVFACCALHTASRCNTNSC